ncbi:rhomboid-domain-containing protein [Cubamyces sp. BRFM 1775]|nr:rhomboid-domain-containing protein [Cubamyces sp. BRFM 1775]
MKRALLSFSPLISSARTNHRTAFCTGLQLRMASSAWNPPLSCTSRPFNVFEARASNARKQSVWHFVASPSFRATHRTSISKGWSRGGGGGGGPQGPWQRLRARINAIPSKYIFWGIIGLNGLVFASWNLAWIKYESTRDPSSFLWMRRNFVASAENLRNGRWWTLVTCCFSHQDITHLLFNGFAYYFTAPVAMSILGNVGFLGLYLGSGIVSSFVAIAWRNYIDPHVRGGSIGASGAIYAVTSFFACVAPKATFALYGVLPVPAWVFVSGIFLWDGYHMINQSEGRTDHAGHIGGLLSGVGFFIAKRLRIF